MATQDEQMNMLMQQGGMQDDGMTRDPVSGNEVPPGSLASEVRDDIPAQLSEGEYVIPADAVQFHGLKFYEASVQEAKMGLSQMQANGRIGGEPMQQNQTPQALPFDLSELQTNESAPQEPMPMMPQQANKGGLIRGFAPGGFTGVSGDTSTAKLDYSKPRNYFNKESSTNLARFIASGCKQKEILVSGNRVPITSTSSDGIDYVDITSDAGLNILKGCSEISLNPDEEKLVINRIGQDEYNKYKGGDSRPVDSGQVQEETEPQPDDDDGRREVQADDFIRGWGMDKMADYYSDMGKFYDGTEDTLIGGLLKGITKPIVKLNHKHVVARSMAILQGGVDPKTNEQLSQAQTDMLNGLLKMNPDGMIQGTFKANGMTIMWNPETGTFESASFKPISTPINPTLEGEINKPNLTLTPDEIDKANQPARTKDDITYASNFEIEERERDSREDSNSGMSYDERQSSPVYQGSEEATKIATQASAAEDNKPQTQEEKEEEKLSSAYSSSDSLASGKFMNKGGLAKKRKTTKKK